MAILEFPIRQSAPNYIALKYICVSRFRVLPAQYQILSLCPSLLYVHGGPMGIFNIRSENFWVNQNEKCENILSIRSGSCAEELPISEGELQWKMGCNIQRRVILRNNFDVKVQVQVTSWTAEIVASKTFVYLSLDAGLAKLLQLIF